MAQQNQYPPPQYGPPSYGPPPRRSRGPLILVGVLGLVLVVVVAVGAVLLLRADDSKPAAGKAVGRPSTPEAVQFRPVLKTEQGQCDASPAPDGTACDSGGIRYTLGKVELNGTRVTEVKATAGPDTGTSWIVSLSLDDEGTKSFTRLTTELAAKTPPQNQLAIVVRGRVVSAPTVMSPITGGEVQINSNFTRQDAEKLAADITG